MKLLPWITLLTAVFILLAAGMLQAARTPTTDAAFLYLPADTDRREWWLVLPDGSDARPVIDYPARVDILAIDTDRVIYGLHETLVSNAYIAQAGLTGGRPTVLAELNPGADRIYTYDTPTDRVIYRTEQVNRRRQTEYAFFTFRYGQPGPHRHITTESAYAIPFYFGEDWLYFVAAGRAPDYDRFFRFQYDAPVKHSIFNFNAQDLTFLEFFDEQVVYLVVGERFVYRSDLTTGFTSPLPGFAEGMRVQLITPDRIWYTVQPADVYSFDLATGEHDFVREIDPLRRGGVWLYEPALYGDVILLLADERRVLLRMSTNGLVVEELLRVDDTPIDDFLLTEDAVYYTVREGVDLRLWRYDLGSAETRLLTTMAGTDLQFDTFRGVYAGFIHLSYDPAWSNDRRHLIIDTRSGQRAALEGLHGGEGRWGQPISLRYRSQRVLGAGILLGALAGLGVLLQSVGRR
jgi:hypothetical protein